MDDIKLFAKNEKELQTLIHTVRIYSQGVGIEFATGKCALSIMKSGKQHLTDGIELPNQDNIKKLNPFSSGPKMNLEIWTKELEN